MRGSVKGTVLYHRYTQGHLTISTYITVSHSSIKQPIVSYIMDLSLLLHLSVLPPTEV